MKAETDRLVLRPFQNEDYQNWLHQFEQRKPSLSKHDKGRIDMSECSEAWFEQLVEKHQALAREDKVYVLGVFRKEDGAHLGAIDISTIMRRSSNGHEWDIPSTISFRNADMAKKP